MGYQQDIEKTRKEKKQKRQRKKHQTATERCHILVSYTKGLFESYKSICGKYRVQVYFKGGDTLKSLLMFQKDKEEIKKQNNIIYWYKCDRTECDDEYIGESARTFEERYKEYLKTPSPTFEQINTAGHTTSVENFKVIGREGHGMARTIRRPFTSESITLPLTGMWTNITYHIFGTKSCFPSQN